MPHITAQIAIIRNMKSQAEKNYNADKTHLTSPMPIVTKIIRTKMPEVWPTVAPRKGQRKYR